MDDPIRQVVTQSQERYFGKYRGLVVDNQDPENRARVTLKVPSVLSETVSHWAEPCLPFGGLADQGLFLVPEIGAQVWVEFEEGNPNKPIWTGTLWQRSGDVPAEAAERSPNMRQLKTPCGHILSFDDTAGEEAVRLHHAADAELKIDPQGSVQLSDSSGASLEMDASGTSVEVRDANGNSLLLEPSGIRVRDGSGNEIQMQSSGVTVRSGAAVTIEGMTVNLGGSGGEPLIKGTSFLSLFATHIHTCSAPGSPSSPPVPQGEMSTLSKTALVK